MDNKYLKNLLDKVQQNILNKWPSSLKENPDKDILCSYISSELKDKDTEESGMSIQELILRLYYEMSGYSFLSEYLDRDDIDEININSWDDICVCYSDGKIEKTNQCFFSPEHALDIVRRLLRQSGKVIDDSTPISSGHLKNNSRISAIKSPITSSGSGVSASIRILHPNKITQDTLIKTDFCTSEMLMFLQTCINHGVSMLICGRTNSGKTTVMSSILSTVPYTKRVYVIESGAREIDLVKRDDKGNVLNNVVQTLSRPSDDPKRTITQEDLVETSLRFDPDVIAIGEIRNSEAFSAVEASLTGHTVISTVHSGPGESAHSRIALLCQRRFNLGYELSLDQVRQAFPVIVFAHRNEKGERRILDITECYKRDGKYVYSTVFNYLPNSTGAMFRNYPLSKELLSRIARF